MNASLAYNSPAPLKFRPPARQEFRLALPHVVDKQAFRTKFQDEQRRELPAHVIQEFSSDALEDITEMVELGDLLSDTHEAKAEAEVDKVMTYSRKAHALFHLTWLAFVVTAAALIAGYISGQHIFGVVGSALAVAFTIVFFACVRQASDETAEQYLRQ